MTLAHIKLAYTDCSTQDATIYNAQFRNSTIKINYKVLNVFVFNNHVVL